MPSADIVPLMYSPTNTPNDKTYSALRLAPRMTFFPASAKKSWSQADEGMELMLQAGCPAFNKMSTKIKMSNLINVIKTYFSKPPEPEQTKPRLSRPHEHEIKRLRRQLCDLHKAWRQCSTEPSGYTLGLRQAFHTTHRRLKRLTADSRSCRLTSKRQSTLRQFRADLFRFGQRVFKPPNETKPDFAIDADTAYTHFISCYTDDDRSSVFEPLDNLTLSSTVCSGVTPGETWFSRAPT